MKKVEAIIAPEKLSVVNDALKGVGVSGVLVENGKGRGAGKREAGHARGYYLPQFHSRTSIMTVVEDSKVDAVVNAILSKASTGSPSDGKIFISTVDDAVDIGSKRKGTGAV
jgi:nitrogen regulatory protein P-II 1